MGAQWVEMTVTSPASIVQIICRELYIVGSTLTAQICLVKLYASKKAKAPLLLWPLVLRQSKPSITEASGFDT